MLGMAKLNIWYIPTKKIGTGVLSGHVTHIWTFTKLMPQNFRGFVLHAVALQFSFTERERSLF